MTAEKALDALLEYWETGTLPECFTEEPGPHGKLVEYKQSAYHDIYVYEDGTEEMVYIGD